MNRLALMLLFLAGITSLPAQQNGIEQDLELVTYPNGEKVIFWYGHVGRSYFLQVSDPTDHLKKWHWANIIEGGEDKITSHQVEGTADKGFFRLKYTDQVPGPNEDLDTADFDGDGISNKDEVEPPEGVAQTDPLNPDTDGDGLWDGWERDNGLDPNDATGINGADGDPDGDGLCNYEEWWNYSDPHNSDTDGDGLSDGDEVHIYGSYPWIDDSDWDGISDYNEVIVYGTDPNNWDTDGDTLSDWDEIFYYVTNPLEMDTDGDWMWDDYEIDNYLDPNDPADGLLDADGDTLPNQLEFVFMDEGYDPFTYNNPAVFPWASDPDWDGLSTQVEFVVYLTNPKQPDTDGDGMDDGWEILYGFPVLVNNLKVGPANQHPDADPDGDGLTNAIEGTLGTNPNSVDTDGDGVNDNVENDQGSNPNDPNDHTPPPHGTVPVNVTFGDDSGSHSEKYRVQLTPVEGDTGGVRFRSNRQYGQSQTDTFRLPKGSKYEVRLFHIGTDPKYRDMPNPDYDYTLDIPQLTSESGTIRIIKDTDGIIGTHWESDSFFAAGKSAELFVMNFEITPQEVYPLNRNGNKFGVAEDVDITVTPEGAGPIAWSMNDEENSTIDTQANYNPVFTAASVECDPQVIADFGNGISYVIQFNVVEPTGEIATKEKEMNETDLGITAQEQGVGMILRITLLPDDVSFKKLDVRELPGPASNPTGYFDPNVNPSVITAGTTYHTPAIGWQEVDESNQYGDEASFKKWPKIWVAGVQKWIPGSYEWSIQLRWQIRDSNNEHTLPNRIQKHEITSDDGTSIDTKLEQTSDSRTPTP